MGNRTPSLPSTLLLNIYLNVNMDLILFIVWQGYCQLRNYMYLKFISLPGIFSYAKVSVSEISQIEYILRCRIFCQALSATLLMPRYKLKYSSLGCKIQFNKPTNSPLLPPPSPLPRIFSHAKVTEYKHYLDADCCPWPPTPNRNYRYPLSTLHTHTPCTLPHIRGKCLILLK